MSTSVIPDMYRHTARKSTVSKSMKSMNGSSSPANSRSFLVNHHDDKLLKVASPMKTPPISYQIKMEKDISTSRFLILPDNETEQMIVDDDVERVAQQILEQILDQIPSTVSTTTTDKRMTTNDQIPLKNSQVEIDEIHQVLHSMLNTFHENDRQTSERNASSSRSSPTSVSFPVSTDSKKVSPMPMPMDEDEPSILSSTQSHIDDDEDDIEEIPSSANHEQEKGDGSCTCQCHLPSSALNNEYQLFEQTLRKTRLECEQEKSMQNNHLIQTLKRQHEELMSFVQQNKRFSRPTPIARVDREQQTNKLTCQDFQIQTDIMTINTNGTIPPVKSSTPSNPPTAVTPSSSATSNGPLAATRISSSSSTIARPRLSTNSKSNGTASPLPPTQVSPNNSRKPMVVPPPAQPARTAHDVVDLTEEDEDDDTSRVPTQRVAPPRVAPVAAAAPTTQPPTTTPVSAAAPVAARTRPSTTSRPSDPLPSAAAQTFPLRPLPEHTPCDHSIARPQLSITQENGTVRLTWNLPLTPMEAIQNYEIYAYKQNAAVTTSDWKKIGTVKSMRLPMAVTLKEFQSNSHYAFAVRAVSTANQIGPFCEPKTIFTGNTPVQPLHTSQLLNVSS